MTTQTLDMLLMGWSCRGLVVGKQTDSRSYWQPYHSYGDTDDLGSVGELVDAHQWEHSESSFGGLY